MSESKQVEVSFTAKVMAAGRAIESQRPNALFVDPFAERLAGEESIKNLAPFLEKFEKEGRPYGAVRTRFFDDFLMDFCRDIRQVIILGAGLDARAFYLNWQPETHVYEIDAPDVLHYKESVLQEFDPKCHRHSICADLREESWSELLLEKGYQPSEPTAWLLEGFIYYLNEAEVHTLMTTITKLSATGSCFGADAINTAIKNGSDEWAKYWRSSCDNPEQFFANYGWKALAIQPGEEGACYDRFTYQFPDRSNPDAPHMFFVTACKEN